MWVAQVEGDMVARQSQDRRVLDDWIANCLATGVAISRSDDFHEIVEQFILREVHMTYLLRHVQNLFPRGFPVTAFLSQDKRCLFLFNDRWKAAVELTWAEGGIACYQFWFADPEKMSGSEKDVQAMEMNVAATAVEKAFLIIDHATHLRLTYVAAKDRDFEIGPKSASSFGLAAAYKAVPIVMAKRMLAETLLGMSDDVIAEYLADKKNQEKLGSESAGYLLAMRYLGTRACPPAVAESLGSALASRPNPMAPRFCRKCGFTLPQHARFCGNCGAQTSGIGVM